ncbi:extracellular solute-binding protein [Halomonas halocynthiae]|uniref:extracellular solute-binding protein n=1 Tax=Halomonas halocynthiae TaxID=176290 RepID=UPI0004196F1E|nr:extracellular solute-binding protein [Halomonas halocynthiae]
MRSTALLMFSLCFTSALTSASEDVPVRHGLSLYGEPALAEDFTHFPYANPDAPLGGSLARAAIGSFDSTNPFIIQGTQAVGLSSIYDTLMVTNPDEPFSMYGLLAEGIRLAPDRSWVEFDLHPQARFHDGEPITADDVVFSFTTLTEKGQPFYGAYYADVTEVSALNESTVRFTLGDNESRELPLIIGQLPILPAHYWQDRDFEVPTRDALLGSGPYRIANVDPGRRIVYERVDDYWGKDLPVNRGRYNIDTLIFDYYRDHTVALEAFKAGNLDMRIENSAREWATGYDFPATRNGLVKRLEVPTGQPAGMQAFVMNERRPLFEDKRVRQAFNLVFDFDWLNQNLFYDAYQRTQSYFEHSDMAASGLPEGGELALLEPYRDQLPDDVFNTPLPIAQPDDMRERLRQAMALLQDAGYAPNNAGELVHQDTGEPLRFEVLLHDSTFERVVQPLLRNLSRLGITGKLRTVDVSQYLNRLRDFDFDMIVGSFRQSNNPGNEQREFWASEYANQPRSRNLIGLEDPVVDELVDTLIAADSRESLQDATRALDRVLLWGFHVIPQWYLGNNRIAIWDKFAGQEPYPEYGIDLDAWWVDPQQSERIEARQRSR